MQKKSVISDTSVIINFLRIDRIDLLTALDFKILITDHVKNEVHRRYADQYQRLISCLQENILTEVVVNTENGLHLFKNLIDRVGRGEASAIAYSAEHQTILAIDDKKAIKEAKIVDSKLIILKTQELIELMIQKELITIKEAIDIIRDWSANHRFKLKTEFLEKMLQVEQ